MVVGAFLLSFGKFLFAEQIDILTVEKTPDVNRDRPDQSAMPAYPVPVIAKSLANNNLLAFVPPRHCVSQMIQSVAGPSRLAIGGKGKSRALDLSTLFCPCPTRQYHSYLRTISPSGGQARIQLKASKNGVFGLATSRGTRAYQEDTGSVSCLHLSPEELQRNYLKYHSSSGSSSKAALEWDPSKAGGEELAGQVVWFGCFDGHGGQQISSFLRDTLHGTTEEVEKDMITDTVQYTRELGGYFRRFTGGVLERWVRKERLKPVRAGPPPGRRGPTPQKEPLTGNPSLTTALPQQKSTQNVQDPHSFTDLSEQDTKETKQGESSEPTTKTLTEPQTRDGTVKIGGSADLMGSKESSTDTSTIQDLSSIERIAPPEGMENEMLSMAERLTLAWLVADRQIQSSKTLDVGGSTASVILLHSLDMPTAPWYSSEHVGLNVAHVGDTRVLLCSSAEGKAIPLTTYHHPDDRSESERLRKMGAGMITDSFGEARWMGALANTRAFGDSRFKKVGITSEPEIFSQVVKGADYSFLVAFSDGVGGVISDQEVVDLCRDAKHPSQAANNVLRFAEELGAQDNCTVIVIPLKAWGKVGGKDLTRERREMRRSKTDLFRDSRQ